MDKNTLHEDRMHGDTLFPIGVYELNTADNGAIMNYHWHQEAEFIYIAEGSAQFQVGTSSIVLSAGEAIFIRSGELHAGYPLDISPFRIFAIVFDLNLLSSYTYDIIQNKYIDPLLNQALQFPERISNNQPWERSILENLTDLIHHYQAKSSAYELKIKANLYLIIAELLTHPMRTNEEASYSTDLIKINRIKIVLQFILDHFQHKIHIHELAALLSISEGHFCRFFKSLLKQTPIEYINSVRINHAIKLLHNPDLKIIDIALDVGFDNLSYFIKTFKRYKKCTPSEFRQQLFNK
jgi:AraC-like DNA-binding protein